MKFLSVVSSGISAFTATNLDDLVILILFFSQVGISLRRRHIIYGQYFGFALLVLASLPGFLGGLVLPPAWIGLLGVVPIILGLNRLFEDRLEHNEENQNPSITELQQPQRAAGFLSPQTYGIAALTLANGSDNIAVYVPLFAHCTWKTLGLILAVFFTLIGVWCYAAYQLTRLPAFADALTHYGHQFVPYVLIGLGGLILWDSQTLADRGLLVIALMIGIGYLMFVGRMGLSEIEE